MPPPRKIRVTIKSVVLQGVRDKLAIEDIAKLIVEQFPDTKGAQDPIRYVKYYMADAGLGPRQQEQIAETRAHHGFTRSDPLPDLHALVDQLIIEGITINIYKGLTVTYDAAIKLSRKNVLLLYKYFTGDYARVDASFYSIQGVVVGEIQNRWYAANGLSLPPRVEANQAQRLEDAKMAKKNETTEKAEKTATPKEPRVTVKSVITAGLLAGKPDADIAAEIQEMFPDKAAAKNPSQHISYYRSALVSDGQLEKQPRQSKPKAEKVEGEAAPAKGKKAAAAPAAAPATPAKAAKKTK